MIKDVPSMTYEGNHRSAEHDTCIERYDIITSLYMRKESQCIGLYLKFPSHGILFLKGKTPLFHLEALLIHQSRVQSSITWKKAEHI